MLRIGAHVSIADGYGNAVVTEHELGGNTGQIFVGSPRGWAVSDVDEDDAEAFADESEALDVGPWIVHGTYLINLATPKDDLAEKSLATMQAEIDACDRLSIPYYCFHPGSHTGAGVTDGIANIGERLSSLDIPEGTTVLLENTAGKGTSLGKSFEHLAKMVEASAHDYGQLGVCLDSCHLYAAGYDFRDSDGMSEMVEELAAEIGVEHVKYLHLNDSKHPLGSEKDEHEHIGDGEIGETGFENFINHEAFRELPMVLETPTGGKGYEGNIERVKELYRS